jgi:hypothetical protein
MHAAMREYIAHLLLITIAFVEVELATLAARLTL